jgi:hypothetical protein
VSVVFLVGNGVQRSMFFASNDSLVVLFTTPYLQILMWLSLYWSLRLLTSVQELYIWFVGLAGGPLHQKARAEFSVSRRTGDYLVRRR